jgi:hypothetical protein
MKSEVYPPPTVGTLEELLARILDAVARIKKVTINSDQQHAIFAHEFKVHWGWRWDFRTFIVNCNKFVIYV